MAAKWLGRCQSGDRPTIQYGILLPILIGALMIWRSETTKRVIAAVPQQWLVGVVVPESQAGRAPDVVRSLLDDPRRLGDMSHAMLRVARPDAGDEIAEELLALAT